MILQRETRERFENEDIQFRDECKPQRETSEGKMIMVFFKREMLEYLLKFFFFFFKYYYYHWIYEFM
jgi:hypothetical protein